MEKYMEKGGVKKGKETLRESDAENKRERQRIHQCQGKKKSAPTPLFVTLRCRLQTSQFGYLSYCKMVHWDLLSGAGYDGVRPGVCRCGGLRLCLLSPNVRLLTLIQMRNPWMKTCTPTCVSNPPGV